MKKSKFDLLLEKVLSNEYIKYCNDIEKKKHKGRKDTGETKEALKRKK
jgi:hypothetical protein